MGKKFPQYLTAPIQILWFEADTFSIIFMSYLVALIFGGFFWLSLIALPYGYSLLKKKYPKGFLKHIWYFTGFVEMKHYPIFFEEEFLE